MLRLCGRVGLMRVPLVTVMTTEMGPILNITVTILFCISTRGLTNINYNEKVFWNTYIQFSRLLSARVDVKKLVKRIISWTLLLVFILRRFWALCFMMLNSWWRVFMIHFHNENFFYTVLCSFRTVLIGNYFILSSWDQIYVLNSPRGYTP